MSDTVIDGIKELVRIIGEKENQQVRLPDAQELLQVWLELVGIESDFFQIAEQIVQLAIEEWIVQKTIDYPSYDDDIPLGYPEWHLKIVTAEEKTQFAQLKPVQHALLKILYSMKTNQKRLGAVEETEAIDLLSGMGFDVTDIPLVPDKVSIFFLSKDDTRTKWYHLIPEYEKRESYVKDVEEMLQKSMDKERREMSFGDK